MALRWSLILSCLLLTGCPSPELSEAQLNPADETTEGWEPVFEPAPEKSECSPNKIAEILEPPDISSVTFINCNLTLEPNSIITKRVILQGEASSGITVDCNGSKIEPNSSINHKLDALEIRSRSVDDEWVPVHDISIHNCTIKGSVRIYGMGKNDGDPDLRVSSRTEDHVYNARDNAPYHINIEESTITGKYGRIPLYIAPGVHHSVINNSTINGISSSVMVYMDAESYGNTISNSLILGTSNMRELIAMDGASYCTLKNNKLLDALQGGIYLYRNCGENGTIRHATPSHNNITNNTIRCIPGSGWFYNGIYVGSRDGDRGFCDEDKGYPYGSSVSDQDHARFNVIRENNLYHCNIDIGNETNRPNIINSNTEH